MSDDKFGGLSLDDLTSMADDFDDFDDPAPVVQPAPAVEPVPAPAPAVEPVHAPAPAVEPVPAPVPVVEPAPAPVVEPAPAPAPVVEPVPAPAVEPVPAADSVAENKTNSKSTLDDVYFVGGIGFKNYTKKLPPSYEDVFAKIIEYSDAGRTYEAQKLAKELVDNNYDNEIAWFASAFQANCDEDYATARKAIQQGLGINPNSERCIEMLGFIAYYEENYAEAKNYFMKAFDTGLVDDALLEKLIISEYITNDSFEDFLKFCDRLTELCDEKEYIQNVMAKAYIREAGFYYQEIPDGEGGTYDGYVSLEDINTVRKYCNKAKSLLTLEKFDSSRAEADEMLEDCDFNCKEIRTHKNYFLIFHVCVTFIIYLFLTIISFGIFTPVLILATYATYMGDFFPRYMFNYVTCIGSDDPLKYVSDSFYKNHELLSAFKEGMDEAQTQQEDDDLFWMIIKDHFSSRKWFFKARIQFYKRLIQKIKDKKNAPKKEIDFSDVSDSFDTVSVEPTANKED